MLYHIKISKLQVTAFSGLFKPFYAKGRKGPKRAEKGRKGPFLQILKRTVSVALRKFRPFPAFSGHFDSTGECRKMGERVLSPFPISAHAAGYTLDDFTMLDVRR